jgi:hypothetical protein
VLKVFLIIAVLVTLGAVFWHVPWLYRVVSERRILYRVCAEWRSDAETVGDWARTRISCFSQASRRRH